MAPIESPYLWKLTVSYHLTQAPKLINHPLFVLITFGRNSVYPQVMDLCALRLVLGSCSERAEGKLEQRHALSQSTIPCQ